jgi:DegV family protein with EDD domain
MKVVTDDGADLLPEEIEDMEITVVPFYIHFPDGELSSTGISRDDFYDRLRAVAPQIPTTASPSPGAFVRAYSSLAARGEEVISLHITGRMSNTFDDARLAAEYSGADVSLVDTLSFSGGQRFQVLAAALAARAGWAKEAILELLEHIRSATEMVFTLGTLEYLQRGGRIGRVQALLGSLLKIKPVIAVDKRDSRFSAIGRGRTLPQALRMIVDYLLKVYGPATPLWLSVLHGQFAEQAQNLVGLLRERLQVARLDVLRISPALGVHAGPEAVGVAAIPIRLLEGLEPRP